jgi:hypothetical protein
MKITLGGRYTIDEFADAVDRVLQTFRYNGVEELFAANLYVNLHRERRAVHLVDDAGLVIEHLKFDGPHERPFKVLTHNTNIISATKSTLKKPRTSGGDDPDGFK